MGALTFPFTIDDSGGVAFTREPVREAINQVVNCLTTGHGERLMRPDFGGNLREYVFEPLDDLTVSEVQEVVGQALRDYVPSVNVVNVDVSQQNEELRVVVFFTLAAEIDGKVYVATVTDGVTTEEVSY